MTNISTAPTPAPVSGSRPAGAGFMRDMAAVSNTPIEGVISGTTIAYKDTGTLLQDGGGQWLSQEDKSYSSPRGLVPNEASQSFAELLSSRMVSDDWPQAAIGMGEASLNILRGHAIAVYEANSRTLAGNFDAPGSSLNIRL